MCEKVCLESRRFYDRFYLVSVFWFEKNGFKVFATKFLLNYSDTHGTQSYYGKIIKHNILIIYLMLHVLKDFNANRDAFS